MFPLQTLALAASAQNYGDSNAQNSNAGDPPNRVARVSVVQGNVSLEPAGVDAFSAAELNYPLTAGDRVYADNNALTELQTSGLALRLANGADLTVTSLTDSVAQFGLAQGSVRLRTRDLYAPEGSTAVVEIDTPNGAILVERPGDIRVDSYPQDDTTVVTVTSGQVEITGAGLDQQLGPNESLRLAGNPVYAERMQVLPPDVLDQFSNQRERDRQQALAISAQYADPNMIGVADLSQYGDWNPGPSDGGNGDYGAVWFPRNVAADWTPYSNGHWAWVAPWGWTWVEAEPWGFAPFHYGRWASFGGRWGWIPGPPPAAFGDGGVYGRPIRPVYSPALVAFVGGPRLSLSIGFGGGSGAGVTAWFPLGPHEAYTPWYHASAGYVNRVNVTNIYNRNVNEVHNTYVNRTTNVYNTNVTNVTYVNRQQATIAVSQRDFAGGRSVAQAQPVRLDAGQRQQLNQAPVLPHPLVTPTVAMAAPQAPARAVPPRDERPVVESQRRGFAGQGGDRGFQGGGLDQGARPGAQPANLNQPRPVATPPQQTGGVPANQMNPQRPVIQPGPALGGARSNIYDPHEVQERAPAGQQPVPAGAVRGAFPQQRTPQPVAAAPVVAAPTTPGRPGVVTPQRPVQAPVQTPAAAAPPQYGRPAQGQPAPVQGHPGISAPQQMPAVQTLPARPLPRPVDQPRALVNRTEPQTPQPSFAQQQRAIERTDPGRPLGPQQVENVRNNRPAGPAAQAEPVAHPAAAPAPSARPGRPQPVTPPVKPADPKQKPQ